MAKKAKAQSEAVVEPVANDTAVTDAPAADDATKPDPAATKKHRRASSSAGSKPQVFKGEELAAERKPVTVAKELSRLNWKMNTPLSTIEGENLNVPLTNPPLKSVKIYFSTGINVTARNLSNGVTIKDALKAIHKMFHKKADDELDLPVLDTMEWTEYFADDRGEWNAVLVKQKLEGAPVSKKKAKKGEA